jgi:hypothetical protein
MRGVLFLSVLAMLLGDWRLAAQAGSPRTVPLKPVDLAKTPMRAGHDFVPKSIRGSAWEARVGPQTFVFVDLDGDGKLQPESDGIGMRPSPFVVPLPSVLLVNTGQYDVTFDGTKSLVLKKQPLGIIDRWSGDASVLNELRIRAGVRTISIDPTECAACEKHCDYLKANQLLDGSGGMAVHEEKPSKPGYTPEGETAGRKSCIGFGKATLREGILDWYATAWHGATMVDPGLKRFAAALKHGVSMFYPCDGQPSSAVASMHPTDDATEIPLAFGASGEIPNPVPGTPNAKGCGFPIYMKLTGRQVLKKAIVNDPKGIRVNGTASSPSEPATKDWPSNSGLALFIPSVPLEPKTKYTVRFEFEDGKHADWSFTTAEK